MTATNNSEAPIKPLAVPVKETCRVLGIGLTKVWELIGTGVLRTISVGRKRLVVYLQVFHECWPVRSC